MCEEELAYFEFRISDFSFGFLIRRWRLNGMALLRSEIVLLTASVYRTSADVMPAILMVRCFTALAIHEAGDNRFAAYFAHHLIQSLRFVGVEKLDAAGFG